MKDKQLSILEFGRLLLEAKDLDPVYDLIWHSGWKGEKLHKWLLSYWCFYHVGTASWIVDQKKYWPAMEIAAGSKDYPRSSERRHFRGDNAKEAVAYLKSIGIDSLFKPLLSSKCKTVEDVFKIVKPWVGFGPWISFKIADMLDRLSLNSISFTEADIFLFDSPAEAAEILWREEYGVITSGIPLVEAYGKDRKNLIQNWAMDYIKRNLEDHLAPPRFERPIDNQEAETILCKWKSYLSGHYEIGWDVQHCRTGLAKFPDTVSSQELVQAGIKAELWDE